MWYERWARCLFNYRGVHRDGEAVSTHVMTAGMLFSYNIRVGECGLGQVDSELHYRYTQAANGVAKSDRDKFVVAM